MTPFDSSTIGIPSTEPVPRHIAIIMDGNGRWAKQRLLPRVAGHRRGLETVRRITRCCIEAGVEYLTLFAFSSENWRRPADEVSFLMQLFMRALESEVAKLHENNIRLRVVGDLTSFEPRLVALIHEAELLTAANTRLTLTIAANYGGRWDIMQAVNRLFKEHPGHVRRLQRSASGAVSGAGLRARARSVHPHRRRAAGQQLLPLATRLHRAVLHRHPLAGLRRDCLRRGTRLVSAHASGASAAPASS